MSTSMPAASPTEASAPARQLIDEAAEIADRIAARWYSSSAQPDMQRIATSLVTTARRLSGGWSDRGRHADRAHLDAVLAAAEARDAAAVDLRCDILVIAATAGAEAAEAAERAADRDRLVESLRAEVAEHRAARDEAERKFAERPSRPRRGFFGGRR